MDVLNSIYWSVVVALRAFKSTYTLLRKTRIKSGDTLNVKFDYKMEF